MKQGQWHGRLAPPQKLIPVVVSSSRRGVYSLSPVLIHRPRAAFSTWNIHPAPPLVGMSGSRWLIRSNSACAVAGGPALWSDEWWWTRLVIFSALLMLAVMILRFAGDELTSNLSRSLRSPEQPHVAEPMKDAAQHEPLAEVQIVDLIQEPDAVSSEPRDEAAVNILSHQDHRTATPMVIDLADIQRAGTGTEVQAPAEAARLNEVGQAKPAPPRHVSPAEVKPRGSVAELPAALPAVPLAVQPPASSMPADGRGGLDRHSYASLLATSQDVIAEQIFQDPAYVVAPELPRGSALSLNTTQYHHMGYFMKMKAQIEQVWSFPPAARLRGLTGNVKVMFQIEKSGDLGKVSILQSSGHEILDREVIRTLALAAPFDPFPLVWSEQELEVTGMFSYVLR